MRREQEIADKEREWTVRGQDGEESIARFSLFDVSAKISGIVFLSKISWQVQGTSIDKTCRLNQRLIHLAKIMTCEQVLNRIIESDVLQRRASKEDKVRLKNQKIEEQ